MGDKAPPCLTSPLLKAPALARDPDSRLGVPFHSLTDGDTSAVTITGRDDSLSPTKRLLMTIGINLQSSYSLPGPWHSKTLMSPRAPPVLQGKTYRHLCSVWWPQGQHPSACSPAIAAAHCNPTPTPLLSSCLRPLPGRDHVPPVGLLQRPEVLRRV